MKMLGKVVTADWRPQCFQYGSICLITRSSANPATSLILFMGTEHHRSRPTLIEYDHPV